VPLVQSKTPRYYMAVGHADNLAPRGLHSSGLHGDVRIPFAAHDPKPEMMASGTIPGLPKIPRAIDESRRMQPEHPPLEKFSFSGKPVSHRLYYQGK
jgi:hypothetical protein